ASGSTSLAPTSLTKDSTLVWVWGVILPPHEQRTRKGDTLCSTYNDSSHHSYSRSSWRGALGCLSMPKSWGRNLTQQQLSQRFPRQVRRVQLVRPDQLAPPLQLVRPDQMARRAKRVLPTLVGTARVTIRAWPRERPRTLFLNPNCI